MQSGSQGEKCEAGVTPDVASNTAGRELKCHPDAAMHRRAKVTVTLRCLNCGFSFTVTALIPDPADENTRPVACGHCRSTRWSSQAA
jgi:DNA-directed RNA polymerase subunit RPC12/RpoP